MTITAGTITVGTITSTSVALSATEATAGTAPYGHQWHRSLTTGFTPGVGNAISGATALTLTDTGLVPGTLYYYKLVYTDDGPSPAEAIATQVSATTLAPVLNPNQFSQIPYLGMIDLRFPPNTVSVIIDVSQSGGLTAGAAVKIVDSAGGVPKVVGCSADNDQVLGFINFDIKTVSFTAGMPAEISMAGNCMYLYSTTAIARGLQVCLTLSTNGGVAAATGSSAKRIVGWAYDKAPASGYLIRVMLKTPSYLLDS